MKYCKFCLQTDTRPNSYLRDDDTCPACHYYNDVIQHADWQERFDDLKESREINSSFQGLKFLASADTSIPADWNELESDFQEDELLLDMDKRSIQEVNPNY